jgi:hypothetical protein
MIQHEVQQHNMNDWIHKSNNYFQVKISISDMKNTKAVSKTGYNELDTMISITC